VEAAGDMLRHAREAGAKLTQARVHVQHGEWSAWLADHFHGSARAARVYMQVARRWPEIKEAKRQTSAILGIDGALKLVAEPKDLQERSPVETDSDSRFRQAAADIRLPELRPDRSLRAMSGNTMVEVLPSRIDGFYHVGCFAGVHEKDTQVLSFSNPVRADAVGCVIRDTFEFEPENGWQAEPAEPVEQPWWADEQSN
jgi:hypothetical protein